MPPADVRLVNLQAQPNADGKRIRVSMEITPFQKRPYIELALVDASGREVASASVIEPMAWKLELTLHIRTVAEKKAESGSCMLTALLSYPELGEIDRRQIQVNCSQLS